MAETGSLIAGPRLAFEPAAASSKAAPEAKAITLAIENMHCGACMSAVEGVLMAVPGVSAARANLSARRATATVNPLRVDTQKLVAALERAGFTAAELQDVKPGAEAARDRDLLKRLAVAGFGAANIMLLSVSVWAGHASDMEHSLSSLFHWLSALIAIPVVAYSGQPFFRSAAAALGGRRLNMDVPISLAITLATLMSLFQTTRGSSQVYFDAAVSLLFFLLIGRYLDSHMRSRAMGAVQNLMGLKAGTATVLGEDGHTERMSSRAILPGMRLLIAAGERIAADGVVRTGVSEVDESLITGETLPKRVAAGERVYSGTVNLDAPLTVEATAADDNTLLAEIIRLMQAAEQGRGRYVRLADRAARIYSPAVHILGLLTFLGWLLTGHGWEAALTAAIAVLIITCPCALALAVPAVQVAASSRLFARGIILKAADGLERLAEVDTVVFDKTGTLTLGAPQLTNADEIDRGVLERAASLALASRHPYSRALAAAARAAGLMPKAVEGVVEVAGSGLEAPGGDGTERLGSALFTGAAGLEAAAEASLFYVAGSRPPVAFRFKDGLRNDAGAVIGRLIAAGYRVELLSGDRQAAVAEAAHAAGISEWRAGATPADKIARLKELAAAGHKVLMIGDGLNDAPALAEGHASISPSTAADVSQTAADAVFQGQALSPVVDALFIARRANRMALQNFAIALAYNAVCVPLAMLGFVTPLIAALAMSGSSITVTGNAVRLHTLKVAI